MKFFDKLTSRFPDLFYQKDGKFFVPCGVSIPEQWEELVEDTLDAINNRVEHTHVSVPTGKHKFYWRFINPLYLRILKVLDPYKLMYKELGRMWAAKHEMDAFEDKHKASVGVYKWFINFRMKSMNRHTAYESKRIPQVKIEQIKEKFNGLRIYISGGDEEIHGMIDMAEYLSHTKERYKL